MWHRIMKIPYETTFFKINGKTNAENSGFCLHNISPLLETTYRTNQNLDKAYSDRLFSQNDPRIRNRNLILFTAECGERKKGNVFFLPEKRSFLPPRLMAFPTLPGLYLITVRTLQSSVSIVDIRSVG